MNSVIKCTLDNNIDFFGIPKNVEIGKQIKVELTFYDKDDKELGKKSPQNVKVEKNSNKDKYGNFNEVISYKFKIKDLAQELNIKEEDISYVNGWMDIDGDDVKTLYDKEVRFEMIKCYCNRDFTVDEVRNIIKELRDSESATKGEYGLFTASNCKLPQSDKTYERFTEELNKIFKKYEINICLRKIHFLAQVYVESDKFKTTEEYESKFTKNYIPFQGRGIKQVTHDYNYLEYYDYINKTNIFDIYQKYNQGKGRKVEVFIGKEPSLNNDFYNSLKEFSIKLSNNINYAFDSAGWYWSKNKINNSADNDNVEYVSKKVNLPYGKIENVLGLENRKRYTKILKKVFNYENCKNGN